MKVRATLGILLFSAGVLSFGQNPTNWGTQSATAWGHHSAALFLRILVESAEPFCQLMDGHRRKCW